MCDKHFASAAFVVLAVASMARAAVTVPPVISDHMVLQRSEKTPVWGRAEANERVEVLFQKCHAFTKADSNGRWRVELDLEHASDLPGEMVIRGQNSITIRDVIVGDVWLCSGQSNMAFTVDGCLNYRDEPMNFPAIRQFKVASVIALTPQSEVAGSWVVASPDAAAALSGVGFFFGREIHQKTKRPIGLINASWGGTGAEAWTSEPALKSDPHHLEMLNRTRAQMAGNTEAAAQLRNDPSMPGVLYNGMIAPILPFRIRGAIWYQGEGNELRADQYQRLLTLMIDGWRRDWNLGDFPFYIVQLAGFRERPTRPDAVSGWVIVRAAQDKVANTVPNCGLATAIDVGDTTDIHPKDKQTVGCRLAALAMAKTYGQPVEYAGPTFQSMTFTEGGAVRLSFTHAEGLVARGGSPKGFTVAGVDGRFVWADARLDGEQIVLWSNQVPAPRRVRFAWADNPEVNLYNAAGFPAYPFEAVQP